MKLVLIITKNTIKSIVRDHVFPLYAGILLTGGIILPLTLKGDGTASGQLQISLTYTFGFIGFFLTFTTVWLSSTLIAKDIESHRVHLVLTKPVSASIFGIGKLLGILSIQGVLLVLASSITTIAILSKLYYSDYQPAELEKVRQEILVGRETFLPQPVDIEKMAKDELDRRLRDRLLPENISNVMMLKELRRQIKLRISEVPAGSNRLWEFHHLPKNRESELFRLRYRIYLDEATGQGQKKTRGIWSILNPATDTFKLLRLNTEIAGFQQVAISSRMIDEEGTLLLKYENQDPASKSVIFHQGDTPLLLFNANTFWQNFYRTVFLVFLQITFIATLGCTAGAIFSATMAVFISSSYIVLGILVAALAFVFPEQNYSSPNGIIFRTAAAIRFIAVHITVPLNEYYEVQRLVRGELVEVSRMLRTFFDLILFRGLPIGLLGVWALNKRELGLVEKK